MEKYKKHERQIGKWKKKTEKNVCYGQIAHVGATQTEQLNVTQKCQLNENNELLKIKVAEPSIQITLSLPILLRYYYYILVWNEHKKLARVGHFVCKLRSGKFICVDALNVVGKFSWVKWPIKQ